MTVTLHHGECITTMQAMAPDSIDAIVTDPPYGLGFMGKAWDDLPPGLDWATECLRVLKPGGHILAFGGTRTWHRLAVAIEDAGFEIRDSIAWLYGSGFPKSLDVSKAIDKANGKHDRDLTPFGAYVRERREAKGWTLRQLDEAMGTNTAASWWEGRKSGVQPPGLAVYRQLKAVLDMGPIFDELIEWLEAEREKIGERSDVATRIYDGGNGPRLPDVIDITAPATDAARQWQGWGTALKPAFEPVVMGRKPLIGTVAANVQAYGTGALNIDATRIAGDVPRTGQGVSANQGTIYQNGINKPGVREFVPNDGGRWPANVALDTNTAHTLDTQSGTSKSKAGGKSGSNANPMSWTEANPDRPRGGHNDEGGASRFFKVATPDTDRDTHCHTHDIRACTICVPFLYVAKAPARERPKVDGIAHPTVKPLALMRWLIRLVTPPGGTILDPFAGSGTTLEAAVLEGFDAVGIEREADYLPLIDARMERVGHPPVSPVSTVEPDTIPKETPPCGRSDANPDTATTSRPESAPSAPVGPSTVAEPAPTGTSADDHDPRWGDLTAAIAAATTYPELLAIYQEEARHLTPSGVGQLRDLCAARKAQLAAVAA